MAEDFGLAGSEADTPVPSGVNDNGLGMPASPSASTLSPTSQQTFSSAITYGLPGIGVGLLDTIGQSLHVIDNNTMPNLMGKITGTGEGSFGDFYKQEQAPLRTTAELATFWLPGKLAMDGLKTVNGLRKAGSISAWAKNSTALDIILGNSASLAAKERSLEAAFNAAIEDQGGLWAGRTLNTPAVVAAKRSYTAAKAWDGARTAVAFELGNYAAFNSSNLFYPPDMSVADQAKWASAGVALGAGLEFAVAKYALRQMSLGAVKAMTSSADRGLSVTTSGGTINFPSASPADIFNVSPLAKDADKIMFRPQQRGVGITAYAGMDSDIDETLKVSNNPANLKTNMYQNQVNIKKVLSTQIDAMAQDLHEFLPKTKLDQNQIEVGLKALKNNPTSLMFATKLSNLPDEGLEDFYAGIAKSTAKAQKDLETAHLVSTMKTDLVEASNTIFAAKAKADPIIAASKEMHYVLEPTGDWSLYKTRADNWLDSNTLSSIKRETYATPDPANTGKILKNSKLKAKADNALVLHDNFRLEIPPAATPLDYSASYAMGSKMIDKWEPVEGQTMILTPQVNWRTLEMTSTLAKAKPEAQQAIKLGPEFTSLDDVDFHVLDQKFQGFMKDMKDTASPDIQKPGSLLNRLQTMGKNLTPAQVIQKYNLPVPVGSQPSPILEMFAHAKLQRMDSLGEMFPVRKSSDGFSQPVSQLDMLQQHLQDIAGVSSDVKVPIAGKLLEQTTDTKPIFVAATATPALSLADTNIQARVLAMRDVQLQRLSTINPVNSPLVHGVIGKIVSAGQEGGDLSGSALTARSVQTLQDGILSGTGQVVYQDRINEQYPTLKAMQLIAQDGDKFTSNYVETLANKSLTPKFATILATKNQNDLFDFNRVEQAYRHGWEISSLLPTSQGYQFVLKEDSKINKQLLKLHFPDEETMPATMPDMSVTAKKSGMAALSVSKSAGDLARAISDMSIQSGQENNVLRAALGFNPIQLRDFHLPTPELNKQGSWFVKGPTGKIVGTYADVNIKQNEQLAKDAADTYGQGYVAVPLETIRQDHLASGDSTFQNLIDYSDQLAKTGTGIKGSLAHTRIDTGPVTLKAMVRSLEEQFLHVGIRSRAAIFEPEINFAQQASDMAAVSTRANSGGFNIFDRYLATAFSQAPKASKSSFQYGGVQHIYQGIEKGMDNTLSWMNAYFSELTGSESTKVGARMMRTVLRKQSSEEEFRQFQKTLPAWSPFEETQQWAESTFKEKSKLTSRELATSLAKTSSTMSLRFLDAGTAINNFAGLMTNAHSVVYGLRKLPNENMDEWIDRTAAWGTQLIDGVVTFSPNKAVNTSIRALWNGELNGPMSEAAKHGYFNPEYASLHRALQSPMKPGQKAVENFITAASSLADKSEAMSRQIAWGMGYKIGKDLHGFTDEKNAYIFANNFVNDMIGNYSPNNKPQMFQGALGLILGNFQTYMFNFYRRLYSNIEHGDKAAVLAQYAAQASVFGGRSVPGYSLWNSYMQSNSDGSDDFTGRVRRNLPAGVGELLLNGSLSNIPKIFTGLQGDALAFYGRGSVDFTQPPATLLDMSKAPPIQFLDQTFKGVKATINNVIGGFSLQQQEEILANYTTNRALKSTMEFAAGAKTSAKGDMIDSHTRDAMHIAAGILGTQASSARSATEAYQRQQNVQLSQSDARETLSAHTKSIIRGGNFTTDDLQGVVQDYISNGGNPAALGQWFRNELMNATEPRTQKTLEGLAKSGKMLEFEDMLATLQQNQAPQQQPKGGQ